MCEAVIILLPPLSGEFWRQQEIRCRGEWGKAEYLAFPICSARPKSLVALHQVKAPIQNINCETTILKWINVLTCQFMGWVHLAQCHRSKAWFWETDSNPSGWEIRYSWLSGSVGSWLPTFPKSLSIPSARPLNLGPIDWPATAVTARPTHIRRVTSQKHERLHYAAATASNLSASRLQQVTI